MDATLNEIEEWRDAHWGEIVSDIATLVKVESVEDLAAAREGAPFGPGPREALDRALAIAGRCGLEAHDCEGYIGFADLPGESDTQIGIIGHVDVVPAGPGWTVEPYAVTRRDGFLLGRGVIDDKGPLLVALHAVRFWAERCAARGERLPYTVRVLFGANEETNMKDVEHYRAHFEDPAFLFTPDSQFPVGYGESGICSGMLVSGTFGEARVLDIAGGQAVNAVPGEAWAVVRAALPAGGETPANIGLADNGDGTLRVEAHGISAHASTPELGENAIGILVDYLIGAGLVSSDERPFFELLRDLHAAPDGSGFGAACSDEHFGPLSMVGGVISCAGGRICQTIDFRYPTTTTSVALAEKVNARAMACGATFAMKHDKMPFLMNPDSQAVRALLDAYRAVTGEDAQGMTSKGGTYARCFTAGVSFGPEKPWDSVPDWVGGMHGPDEGVSEALLKQAFVVYARAIGNLMHAEL